MNVVDCMSQMYNAVLRINRSMDGVQQADVATSDSELAVAVDLLFRTLTIDDRSGADACCVRGVKTFNVT